MSYSHGNILQSPNAQHTNPEFLRPKEYETGGDYNTAGLCDLTEDATAVIRYAKSLPFVDDERIIVCGHSEGAMIATLLSGQEKVAGLILLGGAAMSLKDALLYQNRLFAEEAEKKTGELVIEQIGSPELFYVVTTIQTIFYAVVCGLLGYVLSEKAGLMKLFQFKKSELIKAVLAGVICGVIFSMDYWVFGRFYSEIVDTYQNISAVNVIASVLYGGIIEEVMLRLFVMSLLVFIFRKLFCRNKVEQIPDSIFVIANIIAALLFAALHLPATLATFETTTALVILRCFLLNGGFGIVFGRLYRKYGIHYAMIGHMGCHIISKAIWILFV